MSFRDLRHFEYKDIDQVVQWITRKEFIDDRLVALTLAFSLYRDAGRPAVIARAPLERGGRGTRN